MSFSIKKPSGISAPISNPLTNPISQFTGGGGGGGGKGGGLFGAGFGNTPLGQDLGKTDPWNVFHKKAQVDSTGEVQSMIDKYLPHFKSTLDASGNLPDNLKATAQGVTAGTITAPPNLDVSKAAAGGYTADTTNVAGPDQAALNALRDRATSTGDSAWATLAKQQNELNRTTQMDQAAGSSLGAADMARSQLAMRGGLQSGAAERIAEGSARDLNANRAGIGRAAQSNALGIGISDDQTKMGLLSQIPGMDLANANFNLGQAQFNSGAKNHALEFTAGAQNTANLANANAANTVGMFNNANDLKVKEDNTSNNLNASEFSANAANGANQFNVGNTIAGTHDLNAFNAYTFGQQMQGFGSAKSADAIANAGKK